jgi:hypothetical protein
MLFLGLAGLVLPVLQGWLFIGMGVIILSQDVVLFERVERSITIRFPRVGQSLRRLREKFPILVK